MKLSTLKTAACMALTAGLMLSVVPLRAENTATPTTAQQRRQKRQQWRKNHPARAKENKQMHQEKQEVRQDVNHGTMTKAQGRADDAQINANHATERADAAADNNNGHLTSAQNQAIQQNNAAMQQQIKSQ